MLLSMLDMISVFNARALVAIKIKKRVD